ncbi:MAG: hypothetical protein KJP00_02200 [Bacteroidia bacterium]|nr:hypothetical protein [Bacteroidia bacterium]
MNSILFLLSGMLLFANLAFAQQSPVTWNGSINKMEDGTYEVSIEAKIESGWYVYSRVLESDMGPVPTSLDFSANDGIQLVGSTSESGNRQEGMDKAFGMNVVKYLDEVTFSQKVQISSDIDQIQCTVTFMTCNGEMCLPPKDVPIRINL